MHVCVFLVALGPSAQERAQRLTQTDCDSNPSSCPPLSLSLPPSPSLLNLHQRMNLHQLVLWFPFHPVFTFQFHTSASTPVCLHSPAYFSSPCLFFFPFFFPFYFKCVFLNVLSHHFYFQAWVCVVWYWGVGGMSHNWSKLGLKWVSPPSPPPFVLCVYLCPPRPWKCQWSF